MALGGIFGGIAPVISTFFTKLIIDIVLNNQETTKLVIDVIIVVSLSFISYAINLFCSSYAYSLSSKMRTDVS